VRERERERESERAMIMNPNNLLDNHLTLAYTNFGWFFDFVITFWFWVLEIVQIS
jgi:hypothetical protein